MDFAGGLELDKSGGVMNAASPLGNVKLMLMNGKQSIISNPLGEIGMQ